MLHEKLITKPQIYELTNDPDKTDYILRNKINVEYDYDDAERLLRKMKKSISIFIEDVKKIGIDV